MLSERYQLLVINLQHIHHIVRQVLKSKSKALNMSVLNYRYGHRRFFKAEEER